MFVGLKKKPAGAGMALLRGLFLYVMTWVALSVTSYIQAKVGITSPSSTVLPYLLAGVFLNIAVLRNLAEWHPMWNTLDTVSSTKIKMLIFWPLTYPLLFLRLAVAAYL